MSEDEKMYDMTGVEIKPGDILCKPTIPEGHGERYHACFERDERIEIRDTGNNNLYMCSVAGRPDGVGADVLNLGHWIENVHLLDADDIAFYFLQDYYPGPNLMGEVEKIRLALLDLKRLQTKARLRRYV